ncbi:MAG: HU family DNA-binding protein [Bacillota bacterium]|nr:HU family DNA-binding protein [Clostridia bacterium]MCL6521358.1 HU family DNA-binding protein [Bacillota bacterium]MDI3298432.1 HU family DNA-binding protein [Bacillota bacterium]
MNKNDLVAAVADKTGLTKKDSERVINAVIDGIQEALAGGERVSLVGFGTFEVRQRKSRVGRNPRTGETIQIPGNAVPTFKAGKTLREMVTKR